MHRNNGRTCMFCKSQKAVEAKSVCGECLKICVKCPIEDDWDRCPRIPYNKRPRCGEILTERDFTLCRLCPKKRTGYYYCDTCREEIHQEQVRNNKKFWIHKRQTAMAQR